MCLSCLLLDNIRLSGGDDEFEGRIEKWTEGAWHDVCTTPEAETALANLCEVILDT